MKSLRRTLAVAGRRMAAASPSTAAASSRRHHPVSHLSRLSQRRSFYNQPRQEEELIHFRRSEWRRPWYHQTQNLIAVAVVASAGAVVVYYGNIETVPYTKRRHFVLLTPEMERKLGESEFNDMKKSFRGKVLPPLHPDSIRVSLISAELIRALRRGLRHADNPLVPPAEYSAPHHYSEGEVDQPAAAEGKMLALQGSKHGVTEWTGKEEEMLDENWVDKSREKGKGRASDTRHLEGIKWEVLVVRDEMVNAFCLPGGKIVVFTGLLDHFRTDAEIATVLSHEIGHVIARHAAEMITKTLWLTVLKIFLLQFIYMPDLINLTSEFLLRLPFSRRMELEADHIGLLVMASAGFDPRIAPLVYQKLGKVAGESELQNYLTTHPSSKKRSEMLSQAKVMDRAIELYREAIEGRREEGFL